MIAFIQQSLFLTNLNGFRFRENSGFVVSMEFESKIHGAKSKWEWHSLLYFYFCYLYLNKNLIALHFRSLLEKFLLDTNIFGIDVGRNLHNANNETLLLLYQPNLMFSKPYYNVTDTGARQYLQVYLDYLLSVSKFSILL